MLCRPQPELLATRGHRLAIHTDRTFSTALVGTDLIGRDLFVRTLEGARTSLFIALIATAVSVTIGVPWGAVAGFFGGRTDLIMMRIVDGLYGLPLILIVVLLVVLFGRNPYLLFTALGRFFGSILRA